MANHKNDPDKFSNYQEALGFPNYFRWHEVKCSELELLDDILPQPVLAAIFCHENKDEDGDGDGNGNGDDLQN